MHVYCVQLHLCWGGRCFRKYAERTTYRYRFSPGITVVPSMKSSSWLRFEGKCLSSLEHHAVCVAPVTAILKIKIVK